MEAQNEYKNNKLELYKTEAEYRREIRDEIKTDVESYYKITTTLSTIIPAFSVGLLKFSDVKTSHVYWLKFSWVFFFLALIANLVSLYINLKGNEERILNVSKYYLEGIENAFDKAKKISNLASFIGKIAFFSFIIGTIVLLIFLLISL